MLALPDTRKALLKQLDILVCQAISMWLHLPQATPLESFHTHPTWGGLGIRSYQAVMAAILSGGFIGSGDMITPRSTGF